jgi:hypothetical protein
MPRVLLKNSLLKCLRDIFFKFPSLCHWRLDVLTPLEANPKVKIRYHKLMLRHDTLYRYHLTIEASVSILSSREDEIDLTTMLTAAKSHTTLLYGCSFINSGKYFTMLFSITSTDQNVLLNLDYLDLFDL